MKSFPDEFLKFVSDYVVPEKKILILFSEEDLLDEFLSIHEYLISQSNNISVVVLDYFLHPHLEKANIDFKYIFDFAQESDYMNVKGDSESLALEWFYSSKSGKDPTEFNGLSYGLMLEHDVGLFFHKIMKAIKDVHALFRRGNPDVIIQLTQTAWPVSFYFFDIEQNIFQTLIRHYTKNNSVPIYEFGYPKKEKSSRAKKFFDFKNWQPILFPIINITLRLPNCLISGLKKFYIWIHNFLAKLRQKKKAASIVFASSNSVSYYGSRLTNKLFERPDYNFLVYRGESRHPRVVNFYDFSNFGSGIDTSKLRSEFLRSFEALWNSDHSQKRMEYEGFPIMKLFPEIFRSLFEDTILEIHRHAGSFRRLYQTQPVKLILATSDLATVERVSIMVGKEFNIPSINLQHAIEGATQKTLLGFPRKATYKAAWSHKRKDWLVSRGTSPDNIFVTGCTNHELRRMETNLDLDLSQNGFFLYITHVGGQFVADRQLTYAQNEKIMKALLSTMKKFPTKQLIIKVRPGDRQTDLYSRWIKESGSSNIIISNDRFEYWLEHCDLFLTLYSTGGAEAMMFNKPGIVLGFAETIKRELIQYLGVDDIPFAEYGAALNLKEENPERLVQLIRLIFENPETQQSLLEGRKKFLKDYCNLGDLDPIENFMKLMDKALSSQVIS
jgi:hypothetical protein